MKSADKQRLIERALDDAGRQVDALNSFGSANTVRAMSVASVYIGSASAIVAAAIAMANAKVLTFPVGFTALVAAVQFYIAASICLWVTLPVETYISGSPPDWWKFHLKPEHKHTFLDAMENQVEEYERKIPHLRNLNRAANMKFKKAALFGAATPLVAALTYLFLSLCPNLTPGG